MNTHVDMLKELADLAARELVNLPSPHPPPSTLPGWYEYTRGYAQGVADHAARELVIEEAVEAIEAAFTACPLIFVMDRSSGIPGGGRGQKWYEVLWMRGRG